MRSKNATSGLCSPLLWVVFFNTEIVKRNILVHEYGLPQPESLLREPEQELITVLENTQMHPSILVQGSS